MAESSLWHRLNPFNPRPTSALRRYTPVEDERAQSSIDSVYPRSSDDPDPFARHRMITPALQTLPHSPNKQRTPSILRTLAHHPSLSAIKSKTRRKKGSKQRSPIPPVPGHTPVKSTGSPEGGFGGGLDEYVGTPSPKKLRRKGSLLKASKSIPQDMRLSSEGSIEGMPAMPSSAVRNVTKRRHKRELSAHKRKPVPSAHSSIAFHPSDITPESVRVRRMRFQFDMSMDVSPTKALRRRAASHGEINLSPSKSAGYSPSRHLSTPAPPTPHRSQFASSTHPFTTQHPHPVPLTLSPRLLYDGDARSSFEHSPSQDFGPSASAHSPEEVDDGLELMIQNELMPSGTPGGSLYDLRRGALVDGARHEKKAIRFFSRDMYGPKSLSPSPTPSLGTTAVAGTSSFDKRSSSPFEVKLSPMVTKRMSLDVFGQSPDDSQGAAECHMEELLETAEYPESVDEHPHHTTLSTINEQSATSQSTDLYLPEDTSCEPQADTLYFTPRSPCESPLPVTPAKVAQEQSQEGAESPFIPPRPRHHLSAPPLPLTEGLILAQREQTRALEAEVHASAKIIDELEDENRILRAKFSGPIEIDRDAEEVQAIQTRFKELEEALADKDEEVEELNDLLELANADHEAALMQLRQALSDNEGYFDDLQVAHDDLADQVKDLRADNDRIAMDRASDAVTLQESIDACISLKSQVAKQANERSKAEQAIVELQCKLHEAESQLRSRDTERDAASHEIDAELLTVRNELAAKEATVLELQDLLKAGLGRESELARAQAALKSKDERIMDLSAQNSEKYQQVSKLQERLADSDAQLMGLEARFEDLSRAREASEKDVTAALRSATAKDTIIAVLRDKLRTAGYQKDELEAQIRTLDTQTTDSLQSLREELQRVQSELKTLEQDKQDAVNELELKMSERRIEMEETEKERAGLADELCIHREQLETTQEELASRDATVRDLEEGLQEGEEEMGRLEIERQELLDMLDRAAGDEQSLQALTGTLSETRVELASAYSTIASLRAEVEDTRDTLQTRASTLGVQDKELDFLRRALLEVEEANEVTDSTHLRRANDAERAVFSLQEQVAELFSDLRSKDEMVTAAIMDREVEKASHADVRSRLEAYSAQMDKLSLANASLQKEVEDVRRDSASTDLKLVQAAKHAEQLGQDKELLNVALDSKQTELALLQRQLGQGTPKPKPQGLAASTGRVPPRRSLASDTTPVPARRLATSMSSSSLRASGNVKRQSIPSTPTPAPMTSRPGTATPKPIAKGVLGPTTKHNRTPEKRAQTPSTAKKAIAPNGPRPPVVGLPRKSSLPMLKGRTSMDFGSGRSSRAEVARVEEEEESA